MNIADVNETGVIVNAALSGKEVFFTIFEKINNTSYPDDIACAFRNASHRHDDEMIEAILKKDLTIPFYHSIEFSYDYSNNGYTDENGLIDSLIQTDR